MKAQYIFMLFMAISCVQSEKELKTNNDYLIKKTEKLNDSISTQKLILLTKGEAIKKYGTPSSEVQFSLDDAQGEFRNGIVDKYSQTEREIESILIDELTWEKDKDTWITVWYEVQQKKRAPKEVYEWKKGTEF